MAVASPGNRTALHRIRPFGYRSPGTARPWGVLDRCEAFRPSSDNFQGRLIRCFSVRFPSSWPGQSFPGIGWGSAPPSKLPVQFSQIGSLGRMNVALVYQRGVEPCPFKAFRDSAIQTAREFMHCRQASRAGNQTPSTVPRAPGGAGYGCCWERARP
jgi:hypothetical protein